MRIGQSHAGMLMGLSLVLCGGCGLGPRTFQRIQHPAPLARARAIGTGADRPDSQVVPALVGRLEDSDPVVRLAASEELRRRTGRDFGFVPWGSKTERTGAIERWRAWLSRRSRAGEAVPTAGRRTRSRKMSLRSSAGSDRPPVP